MLALLIGGIYEFCHWDRLRTHDIHKKFHRNTFRHSKVIVGYMFRHTNSNVISNLLLFFLKEEKKWMLMFYCKTVELVGVQQVLSCKEVWSQQSYGLYESTAVTRHALHLRLQTNQDVKYQFHCTCIKAKKEVTETKCWLQQSTFSLWIRTPLIWTS
jgi:hypothetical protein